jgi:hypothetical protein
MLFAYQAATEAIILRPGRSTAKVDRLCSEAASWAVIRGSGLRPPTGAGAGILLVTGKKNLTGKGRNEIK